MEKKKASTVLLVESDEGLRRVITASLERLGLRVIEADTPSTALRIITTMEIDLLIVEHDFPDGNNCKLITAFCQQNPKHHDAVVVTTTQRPSGEFRREVKPGATIYKPFDIRRLCKLINSIIASESTLSEEVSIIQREG